jgi:outer membrane protein assembly factor BamA
MSRLTHGDVGIPALTTDWLKTILVVAALLSLLSTGPVWAQEPPPGTKWILDKLDFEGLKNHKQEDAVAITGMKIGQTVDLDLIKSAAQRLGTAGLFSGVRYRYRYSTDRIEVTFVVEEAKRRNWGCLFDNFVWFSEQEIKDAVKISIPDFDGTAPDSDFIAEKIQQALTEMLRSKSIAGEVFYESNQDTRGRPLHVFKVKDANLKICSIRFAGARDELKPQLLKELQALLKTEYSRMDVGLFAGAALTPFYRNCGYLKVRFRDPDAQLIADGDCKDRVEVTVPVEEGVLYRWDKAVWSGNQVLSAPELDDALGMKQGEVADESKISRGNAGVSQAYGKKGYMKIYLVPVPVFDDARAVVSYQIKVTEGDQYRMGQLAISGLSEGETKKLNDMWRLKTGDVFDSSYPVDFMKMAIKELVISSSTTPRKYGVNLKPDHEKLTVDVAIQFK